MNTAANLLLFLAVLILVVLALPMLLGSLLIGGSTLVERLRRDRCACRSVDFEHDPTVVAWHRGDTCHRRDMCMPLRESL